MNSKVFPFFFILILGLSAFIGYTIYSMSKSNESSSEDVLTTEIYLLFSDGSKRKLEDLKPMVLLYNNKEAIAIEIVPKLKLCFVGVLDSFDVSYRLDIKMSSIPSTYGANTVVVSSYEQSKTYLNGQFSVQVSDNERYTQVTLPSFKVSTTELESKLLNLWGSDYTGSAPIGFVVSVHVKGYFDPSNYDYIDASRETVVTFTLANGFTSAELTNDVEVQEPTNVASLFKV